jgi:putative colanic acid polymerase
MRTKTSVRVAALAVMSLVALHLQFAAPAGYPLTIAPLTVVGLLWALTTRPNRLSLLLACTFGALYPVLIMAVFGSADSEVQFLRSFALWLFALLATVWACSAPLRPQGFIRLDAALLFALSLVAGLSVLQFLTGSLGSSAFFNPWGARQFGYQYDFALYAAVIRSPGFYLEPSFNGLVLLTLMYARVRLNSEATVKTLMIGVPGLLATRSLAALITFALLALLLTQGARKVRQHFAKLSVLLGAVAALAISYQYMAVRLSTAFTPGSSANYRLIAPLRVIRDVLDDYPFGRPMGSMREVMYSYELLNGAQIGSSLDNGIYVVIYTFGWLGIAAVLALGVYGVLNLRVRPERATAALFILFAAIFTGAVFSPEFVAPLVLIVLTTRVAARSRHIDAIDETRSASLEVLKT